MENPIFGLIKVAAKRPLRAVGITALTALVARDCANGWRIDAEAMMNSGNSNEVFYSKKSRAY